MMKQRIDLQAAQAAWAALESAMGRLGPVETDGDYTRVSAVLSRLLDETRGNEDHPLGALLEYVSSLIESYETQQFAPPEAKPADVLRLLMDANGLKQTDLASEIGGQSVVSAILSGRREINARQARALAKRFSVSPALFIGPAPAVEIEELAATTFSLEVKFLKRGLLMHEPEVDSVERGDDAVFVDPPWARIGTATSANVFTTRNRQ